VTGCYVGGTSSHSFGASGGWLGCVGERTSGRKAQRQVDRGASGHRLSSGVSEASHWNRTSDVERGQHVAASQRLDTIV
jgi:hypothetical protein